MTITRKNLILSVAILGFGLVSCTKEKEIQIQADNYQPRDIVVEKADSSFTDLEKLQSLDFSRQLVINAENTKPANQIKNLVLSTTCRGQSSNSSSAHTSNWPNPTKIKILDILPTDTLLSRTNEPIFCDIAYTTTNSVGSTNTGKASNIEIQSVNTFSNLDAGHVFSKEVIKWMDVKDQKVVPIANAVSTIACDEIGHSFPGATNQTTFAQIFPFDKKSNLNITSLRQTCRAIFRTEDTVVLSPTFILELPFNKPTVTYGFSAQIENFNIIDDRQKVEYVITNPNAFPITIQLNLSNKTLYFRTIYGHIMQPAVSTVKEMGLNWYFNGQPLALENKIQEITLPPGATSFLVATVVGRYVCVGPAGIVMNNKNSLLAFNFGLSQELTFQIKDVANSDGLVTPSHSGANYPSASTLPSWIIWHHNVNPAADIPALLSRIRWAAPHVDICK